MKNFFRSNLVFVLWLVGCLGFYLLLFHGAMNVFFVVVIVHLLSLIVALSPVGEWFMRLFDGARKVEILGEVSYIYPLFTEVSCENTNYPVTPKKGQTPPLEQK